jgi:hypothetical protein
MTLAEHNEKVKRLVKDWIKSPTDHNLWVLGLAADERDKFLLKIRSDVAAKKVSR